MAEIPQDGDSRTGTLRWDGAEELGGKGPGHGMETSTGRGGTAPKRNQITSASQQAANSSRCSVDLDRISARWASPKNGSERGYETFGGF